jgi:hypothetical protein
MALFTIAKVWKQPRCPSADEWIRKMWYIYTMGFYSTTKNLQRSFAGKWIELEIIMLSEIRKTIITCDLSYEEFTFKKKKTLK